MTLKNDEKDRPVAITKVALEILQKEKERKRAEGIRMSLGAIASQAIVNQLKEE